MLFYVLHGFNSYRSGKLTTDRFVQPLRKKGHIVKEMDYGWTGLAGVRLCDKKLGAVLAETAAPGSVVLAFSNGCAIASFAADMGALFEGMVMIQPALNRNWRPPSHVNWMDVYYNPGDYATFIAAALPGHRWGAMGHFGPGCKDPRVRAFNTEVIRGTNGHTGVFKEFDFWGPEIINNTLNR